MILDSNIIIYSIQPGYEWLEDYLLNRANALFVSGITKLEVLGFHRLSESESYKFVAFFNAVTVLSLTDEVIKEAIRLRQQRKRSLGDSIIAATALIHKIPVLTHNTQDFLSVEGIEVISLDSIPRS